MELKQQVVFLDKAGVNARSMSIVMPMVLPDGSRVVWCPRCPRDSCSPRASRRLSTFNARTSTYTSAARSLSSAMGTESGGSAGAGSAAPDSARRGRGRDTEARENTDPTPVISSDCCCEYRSDVAACSWCTHACCVVASCPRLWLPKVVLSFLLFYNMNSFFVLLPVLLLLLLSHSATLGMQLPVTAGTAVWELG